MALELVNQLPYDHPYRWDGTLFGGPKLWRPDELGASLALWLDAADASTIILNGSTVSQWKDKSNNGRNFSQGTAASQPTYNATALSGKPALVFNGSSTFMSAGDTLDLGTNNLTVMSVVKYATGNQSGVVVAKTRYASGVGRYALYRAFSSGLFGTGTQYATWLAGKPDGGAVVVTALDPSTSTKIFGGEYNRSGSGYARIWDNGTITASFAYAGDSSDFNNSDNLWIGAYQTNTGTAPPIAGSYLNGQMSEVVVTLSALSDADRQKLEGYLAWKWDLAANLPGDHPYKTTPPTV